MPTATEKILRRLMDAAAIFHWFVEVVELARGWPLISGGYQA
jgi:hypothetical protein